MNGVLNTGLDFWQLVVTFIIAVIAVISIRISFKFDLNKYMDSRQKLISQKLKNACVHMQLVPTEDERVYAKSFFVSPSGTLDWQCERCGLVISQYEDDFERAANYYMKNIDEYKKMNKKFNKLLKKGGMI